MKWWPMGNLILPVRGHLFPYCFIVSMSYPRRAEKSPKIVDQDDISKLSKIILLGSKYLNGSRINHVKNHIKKL